MPDWFTEVIYQLAEVEDNKCKNYPSSLKHLSRYKEGNYRVRTQ